MAYRANDGSDGDSDHGDGMMDHDAHTAMLTENQQRVLYLLSLHSAPAESQDQAERWVRHQALMVLVYEGIVENALDYDYAPASEMVEGKRMFVNVSQEGKADIGYLREEGLVNGLKISSKEHLPVTMYQISRKGQEVLEGVEQEDRDQVNRFALSPARSVMQVEWTGDDFQLVAADGYRKASTVLAVEEVSYVSSAYIPACLRHSGRPTLSNAHRVGELTRSQGADNIRDDLEEIITLNSVSVIVGEFIPFGSNQMVELNHTMGSPERVLGGFFTAAVQDTSSASSFQMEPGLTAIQILDYALAGHVNLEADIRLPEPDGVVQIETFGVSLHADGGCFFGLQLEAVQDRVKDAISLDHLSRLLVDVQTDSSEIVEPLLSPDQRKMLDLVYRGDSPNRNKVNLIIANEITPHLTAEEYMDKGEYENELKQVLGDTRAAYDVTDSDTLIFGSNGLLLAGPNSRTYEPLLASYVQLLSMDLFAQNLFSIIKVADDDIRATALQCRRSRLHPLVLQEAVSRLPYLHRKVLLLEKVVAFMEESLLATEVPEPPMTAAGRALYQRLALPKLQAEMARRVTDLTKYVKEAREEFQVLQQQASQIQKARTENSQQSMEQHVLGITDMMRDKKVGQIANALDVVQYLLLILACFAFLDRLTGDWTVMESDWFRRVGEALITGSAMVWFLITAVVAACAVVGIYYLQDYRLFVQMEDVVKVSLEPRRRMNLAAFKAFLNPKRLLDSAWTVTTEGDRVYVKWLEETDYTIDWAGVKPSIAITYSAHLELMLTIEVEYHRGLTTDSASRLSEQDLADKTLAMLERYNVLLEDPSAPALTLGPVDPASRKNPRVAIHRITGAGADDREVVEEDGAAGGADVGSPGLHPGGGEGASGGNSESKQDPGTGAEGATAAVRVDVTDQGKGGSAASSGGASSAAGAGTTSGRGAGDSDVGGESKE